MNNGKPTRMPDIYKCFLNYKSPQHSCGNSINYIYSLVVALTGNINRCVQCILNNVFITGSNHKINNN